MGRGGGVEVRAGGWGLRAWSEEIEGGEVEGVEG